MESPVKIVKMAEEDILESIAHSLPKVDLEVNEENLVEESEFYSIE